MVCNAKKSVCMIFNPKDRAKTVSKTYPLFTVGDMQLEYVAEFRYLGHIISNDLSDDRDIQREVRNMFFVLIYLCAALLNALYRLRLFCSEHIVYVYMTQDCGNSTMQARVTS